MKKGEMTSAQIIGLVILAVSFAVILIFIFAYPWKSDISREACHEQIVLRSTANFRYSDALSKAIPIDKCKTRKVCLSMSGNDCEEFGPSTDSDIVEKIKIANKEDVKNAFAEELYLCNSMVGGGNLDFLPSNWGDSKYCPPCARIAFDKEAKEKLNDISYYELYKKMYATVDNDGRRFLEAVYPGMSSPEYALDIFKGAQKEDASLKLEDWKIKIKNDGGYIIIVSIGKEGTIGTWLAAGGVAIGTLAILTGIGAPIGMGILYASGIAGGAVLYYSYPGADGKLDYAPPFIIPYNLQSLKTLGCTDFGWA